MVFSSHLFCFYFLPLALLAYFLVPASRLRARNLVLTVLSYLFYAWAHPAFIFLMLFSTVVDYTCGLVIESTPAENRARRKTALLASIITNLSLLGFFKYFNFGVDSWNALVSALGVDGWGIEAAIRVTLPLGISFYTFQSMSYTIDVYRGRTPALRHLFDFACYVSMFPQLVAGPIIRFNEVSSQLVEREHSWSKASRGVAFFSLGMAKKILLANPCGKIADLCFEAGSLHVLDAWYGVTAYAFQIYFDFSGYSDMAIGLALIFGFTLPKNFDSPYRSKSITEFWRRWHMSLSRWLRDYLYVPLGGNRKGQRRTYFNLAMVMLLGGLWHGASWNFVVWGAFHGLLLAAERARGKEAAWGGVPDGVRMASTFVLVLISWVFFRAVDLTTAWQYLGHMTGLASARPEAAIISEIIYRPYYLGTFLIAGAIVWGAPQTWDFSQRLTWPKALVALFFLSVALVMMETQGYNPFIYFIF